MDRCQARPTNMSDLLLVLLYTQTLLQVSSTARPRVFHQRFATTQRPERYLDSSEETLDPTRRICTSPIPVCQPSKVKGFVQAVARVPH